MSNLKEDLNSHIKDAYDKTPYVSASFFMCSPDWIAAVATVNGLTPPDITKARILELGSASGGNLIPFAIKHPESQLVGLDISDKQISDGNAIIKEVGLSNIELKAMDLLDVDKSLGEFDYIIAHGVYSWVPDSVKQAMLRICQNNLSEHGVAYISYNTYPGWKSKEVIRDAMILRAQGTKDQVEALQYARGMYNFLNKFAPNNSLLKKIVDQSSVVSSNQDFYLIHEYLEPVNDPCYFREFLNEIDSFDLAYLNDAIPSDMILDNYEEQIQSPVTHVCGDNQEMIEEYLDFLFNREFRRSLIINKAQKSKINRKLTIDSFCDLHVTGLLPARSRLKADMSQQIVGNGVDITVSHVSIKAAIKLINKHHPATVSIASLKEVARNPSLVFGSGKQTDKSAILIDSEEADNQLFSLLLILYNRGLAGFYASETKTITELNRKTDKPALSANMLRWFHAVSSGETQYFSNLYHRTINMTPILRIVLSHCNGENTYNDILEVLVKAVQEGELTLEKNGQAVTQHKAIKKTLDTQLTKVWQSLVNFTVFEEVK